MSYVLCGLLSYIGVRLKLLDLPGARRSHHVPTVRGAGMMLFLPWTILCLGITYSFSQPIVLKLWICSAVMAALGALDDFISLPALPRFLVQILSCLIFLLLLNSAELNPFLIGLFTISMVWMINGFNFMDGINGIAAFQTLFCCVIYCVLFAISGWTGLAILCLGLGLAILGFLPWNFPKARLFLGDSGSYLLGFGLAGLALIGYILDAVTLIENLLIWSVFVVDTSLTLLMRLLRKQVWYQAHRQHAYQKLHQSGWSHAGICGSIMAINFLFILPLLWSVREFEYLPAWALLAGYLTLGLIWGLVQKHNPET